MRALVTKLGLVVCLSLSAVARANDTITGGSPTDLVPLETRQVRMVSEDILIEVAGEDWEVSADYVFENLTAREVRSRVGFPEYACENRAEEIAMGYEPMCSSQPLKFEEMRTTVDGVPVAHRKGNVKAKHPWAPAIGTVWLYDVRFPARKQLRISHHYRMRQGKISDGTAWGMYVTRTGALWAGSIGHARFRIHVPVETHTAEVDTKETGLTLTSHIVVVDGKRMGELLLEATDWNPKRNLRFSFNDCPGPFVSEAFQFVNRQRERDSIMSPTEYCENIGHLMSWESGQAGIAGPSNPSAKEVEKLIALGVGNLQICRNFIYALYGRRFEDEAVNRYFYGPKGFVPGPWPYGHLKPNPDYSEAMLTKSDKVTLHLFDVIEKRLAPCEPCTCPKENETQSADAKPAEAGNAPGCGMVPGRAGRGSWFLWVALAVLFPSPWGE